VKKRRTIFKTFIQNEEKKKTQQLCCGLDQKILPTLIV